MYSFHSVAAKSVFLMLLPSPPVVEESLITLVDDGITSGLYLYDSIQTKRRGDGGGGVGDGNNV